MLYTKQTFRKHTNKHFTKQTNEYMPQTFQRMLTTILGNVLKHSGECRQTFQEMLLNDPGNLLKHFGECPQTFQGMLPIFGVSEENYWPELHLQSYQTSMI